MGAREALGAPWVPTTICKLKKLPVTSSSPALGASILELGLVSLGLSTSAPGDSGLLFPAQKAFTDKQNLVCRGI